MSLRWFPNRRTLTRLSTGMGDVKEASGVLTIFIPKVEL